MYYNDNNCSGDNVKIQSPNFKYMSFEKLSHTADIRLRVTASTLQALFQEALKGMYAVMRPQLITSNQELVTRKIMITATDGEALLVDFLNEALSLGDVHQEAYDDIRFSNFSETALEGELVGRKRENVELQIKTATHHRMKFEKNEKGELGTAVIFDI